MGGRKNKRGLSGLIQGSVKILRVKERGISI